MPTAFERLAAALAQRYRIESELGSGGMAHVYRAHDLRHGRDVALKVLRPELAYAVGSDRFIREISTTANLRHPHILPLYDSGEAEGASAKAIVAATDGDDARAAELMEDAAAIYDHAGFVHEATTARRELVKAKAGGAATPNAMLTQREMEVLRLVAKGFSEREVADKLFISPHTAHRHLSNIRLKLNATTQAAAVAHAARIGLI